jgi:uncharacterized protein
MFRYSTLSMAMATICLATGALAEEREICDRARGLVEQMAAGQFDKAVESFDATMKRVLPEDKLRAVWNSVVSQCGPFDRVIGVKTEKMSPYDVVYVTCQFQKTKIDVKVVFTSPGRQVTGLFFLPSERYHAPPYVDRTKFEEKEVSIGKGLMPLSGTLAVPKGPGPFLAVVLVHGSGPNDRNETIGPNRPFADLAQGLACHGIAVLRYEKRTRQYQAVMALTAGSITVKEETVDDAIAAVETLAAQEKIDRKRVFVLGHSLGGMLLPRIGKGRDDVAGFISLAGSTTPLEDVILAQARYLLSLEKASDEGKKQLKTIEEQVAMAKSPALTESTPSNQLPLGVPAKYWLDLRGYDPAKEAAVLKRPLLILQGERDYQVTMDNFARWKAALGSRSDVKFITYPKLNHLFVEGEGKSTPAEYAKAGNVSPEVIEDIARWIEAR